MTWDGFWAPQLGQRLLLVPAGVVVRWLVVRALRDNREQLRDVLVQVVGAPRTGALSLRLPSPRPDRPEGSPVRRINPREFRKGIAAAFGVLLSVLLTWAATDGAIATVLAPLVSAEFRPAVATLAGGLALIASVVIAKNDPKPGARRSIVPPAPAALEGVVSPESQGTAPTTPVESAPPHEVVPTASTGAAVVVDAPPWWAGTRAGAPTTSTSVVRLAPVPESSPL